MHKDHLTQEQISEYARQYEELMWRIKSSADAGAYDHMRNRTVMIQLIESPTNDLISDIKDVIRFDLLGLKARRYGISELLYETLDSARTGFDITRVVKLLKHELSAH